MSVPTLRFAPSPNGRLHLGHACSALLNAAFAKRLGGRLLLRIEDIDAARSRPELVAAIQEDLAWLGLSFDGPARRQSEHFSQYAHARDDLAGRGLVYPCFCSRGAIAARVGALEAEGRALVRDPDGVALYPGTCRALRESEAARRRAAGEPHTWRLDMARALSAARSPYGYARFATLPPHLDFHPESRPRTRSGMCASADPEGAQDEDADERFVYERIEADPARWGDAVLARRDMPTSYHLAVVLDDAAQGITHVVRGQDLEAATDLHVLLQTLFGLPTPAYHHHGLIRAPDGGKLAKSKGSESLADLRAAGVTAAQVREGLGFA